MCIGERIHIVRFGGKVFGQVQGDAAAGSLFSSRYASLCPLALTSSRFFASSLRREALFSFSSLSLSLFLSITISRSPVGTVRFVSFFVSGDKPMMCSRRSRRPTAYTRTRQLLRTTRHIVSNSPLPLTAVSLLFSLSIFEACYDALRIV